ncbi:hypothetical protein [Olleya namhaensis]|uniref:hypothetical protein n=1 Tax=Olleya namhaensis TaxID=1144750 RepID=UPI002490A025|nr:hypothetical protein [Olleya namhaensis]
MTIKQLFSFNYLKQKDVIFNLFVYLSFIATVLVSIIADKKVLTYFMPVAIFAILLKYISLTKQNVKPLYIIGLLAIIVSDLLTFLDFNTHFKWITILTSLYLISSALILRKYLLKGQLKSILYFSVFIGLLLVSYIIYSVLDLILDFIPEPMLLYIILNAFSVLIFTILCALIYVNDHYDNSTILLGAAIFCLFHIGLTPINEFIAYNDTFTVLIVISHVLSIYLFMRFITTTEAIKTKDIKQKYF